MLTMLLISGSLLLAVIGYLAENVYQVYEDGVLIMGFFVTLCLCFLSVFVEIALPKTGAYLIDARYVLSIPMFVCALLDFLINRLEFVILRVKYFFNWF